MKRTEAAKQHAAPILAVIADDYDLTWDEIAQKLNDAGYETRRGNAWAPATAYQLWQRYGVDEYEIAE